MMEYLTGLLSYALSASTHVRDVLWSIKYCRYRVVCVQQLGSVGPSIQNLSKYAVAESAMQGQEAEEFLSSRASRSNEEVRSRLLPLSLRLSRITLYACTPS